MYNDIIDISREHFQKIEKIAHFGSWKINLATGRVFSTPEAGRIYGINKTIITFEDIKIVPLPEYRAVLDKALDDLVAGTAPYDLEFRIRRVNDGEIRYIHSIAEYDSSERIVTGFIQDITDRKKMEIDLFESEKRFKSLFASSVSGLIYVAVDGRILEINQSMLRLLGSPPEEKTREINVATFPLLVKAGFSADFKKAVETGQNVSNSVYYRSLWGAEHHLEYNLTPIISKDNILGIMGQIEDVTERMEAKVRIETLLKEKDIILREVHHRIKNNMSSIEGLLKLQMENCGEDVVKSGLVDAISRLSSMRILYEKLYQSDNFMEVSSRGYLSKLIDDIADVFPDSESIRIIKNLDDFSMPSNIIFSLGIIINELITNALKYAFTGAATEKLIKVSAEKNGTLVRICVRDNGVGFPVADEESRTGFGLQLIRMLSQQIDGNADFYNDNGAVFTIDFRI